MSFSRNSLPFQDPCHYPGIPVEYRSVLQDFKTKMPQSIQIFQASDFILRFYKRSPSLQLQLQVFLSQGTLFLRSQRALRPDCRFRNHDGVGVGCLIKLPRVFQK